jgi:Fe-S oxidoreductase
VDADRSVPPFARETFPQWIRNGAGPAPPPSGPRVVLFADSFNSYHTPPPLQAAAQVLWATGHRVEVPTDRPCCGRTLLSKGRIPAAQRRALRTVETLFPYAEEGVPIVGLEPSCILTLRDEFLDLLPGEPRAEAVAGATYTFEEYLADRLDTGLFDTAPGPDGRGHALLHGHCHQKALIGTAATERVLEAAGYQVQAVDAGCCGMAGSFGYEAEHVDVSKQMAELRLAPAVRDAAPTTTIVAPGFSCRSQIKDVTGRTAHHPAELLRNAVEAAPSPAAQGAPAATSG